MTSRSVVRLRSAHGTAMAALLGFVAVPLLLGSGLSTLCAATVSNSPPAQPFIELRLTNYVELVRQYNESVQAQMLDTEANRAKAKAEYGIFEPNLVTTLTREANRRTNNVEQQAAQSGNGFFNERNTIIDGGLETLVPSGGKVRLGATISDLVNNVNPSPFAFLSSPTNITYTRQYQTFVGATFTQPLLKNAGSGVTLAGIRLAALESEIAAS